MLNVCLIYSALLIVKVIFVITAFSRVLFCVSTILVNKFDHFLLLVRSLACVHRELLVNSVFYLHRNNHVVDDSSIEIIPVVCHYLSGHV